MRRDVLFAIFILTGVVIFLQFDAILNVASNVPKYQNRYWIPSDEYHPKENEPSSSAGINLKLPIFTPQPKLESLPKSLNVNFIAISEDIPRKPMDLIPLPSNASFGASRIFLSPDFKFVTSSPSELMTKVLANYEKLIWGNYPDSQCLHTDEAEPLESLEIIIADDLGESIPNGKNEVYNLKIDTTSATLKTSSIFGVMRGLETFRQLVNVLGYDKTICPHVDYVPVDIQDEPRFPFRGIMLDLARNYYTLPYIKNIIRLMAMCKLNVLQLHLTDDVGLALQSKKMPDLAIGSTYINGTMISYSQEEMKEIIEFCGLHGIRVIPEVNMPGHSAGWIQAGIVSKCPGHACNNGWSLSIDVTKEKTYEVLETYLQEVAELFPDPMLHLGGDEVTHGCWQEDSDINAWLREQGKEGQYNYLVDYFEQRLVKIVEKLNKNVIRWEESFGRNSFPPITYQLWITKDWMNDYLNHGSSVIISHGWYFRDMPHWHLIYNNDWNNVHERILGGTGCIWEISETHFNEYNVYPHFMALGEKLWTPKEKHNINSADERIPLVCKQGFEYGFYVEKTCEGFELFPRPKVDHDAQSQWAYRDIEVCHRNGNGNCNTPYCHQFGADVPELLRIFRENSWWPSKNSQNV